MTHGWPGSFLEFERVLGPLTDPLAGGGGAGDAFDVVVPSLPGYGFSGKPSATGWDIHRIARAWAELMTRLGYDRFLAQGSDWGTSVSTSLALQRPGRLLGIHLIPPLVPPGRNADDLTSRERAALADLDERSRTGSGYSAVQGTRPQTIGYSLADSPTGLCAWIVEKLWAWTDHSGDLGQVLTADQVLDNITLYWLTGTGASSARLYWESITQVTPTSSPPPPTTSSPSRPDAASSPRKYRGHPAARRSAGSPTSCTGTNPTAAATSPPGNNPPSSLTKSAPSPEAAATIRASPREHPRPASQAGTRPPGGQKVHRVAPPGSLVATA